MDNNATIVPKGSADEERDAMRRKFRLSSDRKTKPGTSPAVYHGKRISQDPHPDGIHSPL
jgi:hypothetical protein